MKTEIKVKAEFEYKGKKCLVIWVGTHFCAYVETKLKSHYDKGVSMNVNCHGGVTFGATKIGVKNNFDVNILYYGMDFAHYGDAMKNFNEKLSILSDGHKWTLKEVKKETEEFANSLIKYEKNYIRRIKDFFKYRK